MYYDVFLFFVQLSHNIILFHCSVETSVTVTVEIEVKPILKCLLQYVFVFN